MAATATPRLDMCQKPQQTAEVNLCPSGASCHFVDQQFTPIHTITTQGTQDATHTKALNNLIPKMIKSLPEGVKVKGVGHRIVHGGQDFIKPTLMTKDAIAKMEALTELGDNSIAQTILGKLCTELVLKMVHRIWKETKLQPGTAGTDNMLGCCLNSFHFLWAILNTSTV